MKFQFVEDEVQLEEPIVQEEIKTPRIVKPKVIRKDYSYLLDELEQLKTYFRKGKRPSQSKAIEIFEKHLKELINRE